MFERPSDVLDFAAELTQREIDSRLAEHKARAEVNKIVPKGYCHNCDEELEGSETFCDSFCVEDYEWRTKRK
jgi:hypothetical protein